MGVNKLSKVHFLFTFLPLQVGENMQKNSVFDAGVGEIIHLPFSTRKKIWSTFPYAAFSQASYDANHQFQLGLYRRRMDEADIFVNGEYTREDREAPQG